MQPSEAVNNFHFFKTLIVTLLVGMKKLGNYCGADFNQSDKYNAQRGMCKSHLMAATRIFPN